MRSLALILWVLLGRWAYYANDTDPVSAYDCQTRSKSFAFGSLDPTAIWPRETGTSVTRPGLGLWESNYELTLGATARFKYYRWRTEGAGRTFDRQWAPYNSWLRVTPSRLSKSGKLLLESRTRVSGRLSDHHRLSKGGWVKTDMGNSSYIHLDSVFVVKSLFVSLLQ